MVLAKSKPQVVPRALDQHTNAVNCFDVDSVSVEFQTTDKQFLALDRVSLSIAQGEFVSLVGSSGAGKTTLLNLLAGLLQPASGSVQFRNEPVVGATPMRTVVFQEYALFPWMTVAENIDFGLRAMRMPKARRSERVGELVDLVGLSKFAHRYPAQISGGMKQRAALARALAVEPDAILMDEPFGALDAFTREALQVELLRIWEQSSLTIVMVTHNIDEAIFLSDRVVTMAGPPGHLVGNTVVDIERPRQTTARFHDSRFRELEAAISDLVRVR